ncbi:MAG: hypothetical protein V1772_02590 [Chloroflexota bacterium]
MKRTPWPLLGGIGLVVLGALLLLQGLGLVGPLTTLIWFVLFALAGAAFLYVYVSDARQRWWAAIPGFSLLGLAALIGLENVWPRLGGVVGAPIFLGAIGLSFFVVYLTERRFWWAIIPGGVMLSVAAVALAESLNPPFDAGGLILIGMGLTFALVAVVPTEHGHLRWALIPAGVLLLIGILVMAESLAIFQYAWALALIAAGLFFVLRGVGRAKAPLAADQAGEPTPSAAAPIEPFAPAQPAPDTKKLDVTAGPDQER